MWIVAGFCQNLLFFAGLTGFRRDLSGSWRDQARSLSDRGQEPWIKPKYLQLDRRRFTILLIFFPLFAKGSWPLSDRLDKIRLANYFEESYFQWIFRLGRLKIGFPCSNPSTNSPVSGFGGEDSLLTIIGIGLAGLGGWVGWRVWLDTPNCGMACCNFRDFLTSSFYGYGDCRIFDARAFQMVRGKSTLSGLEFVFAHSILESKLLGLNKHSYWWGE